MTTILITGASSGLGEGLALHYAAPATTLLLTGRSEARLAAVAEKARAKGAIVEARVMDVTDKAAMEAWLGDKQVELAIANAGISAGTGIHGETASQAEAIFATNVGGVLNTLHPLIPAMQARRSGTLVIIASVAGMIPVASAPAYSASKACVRAYGLALRGQLKPFGVNVVTVCPGYIKTAMTDANTFPMPFLMEADKAAAIIANGIAQNKAQVAFPWPMVALVTLVSHLPQWLLDAAFRALPKKAAL